MRPKSPPAEQRIQSEPLFSDSFRDILLKIVKNLKKESSRSQYYLQLRALCAFPPAGDFLDLTPEKLALFYQTAVENNAKPSSLYFTFSIFRSAAKAADEALKTNLSSVVGSVKLGELPLEYKESSFPALSDVDKVLSFCISSKEYTTALAISLALKLSFSTKDLTELKRKQFQFDAGNRAFIRFANKKFGCLDRIVYVPDDIAELIEKYVSESGRVFTDDSFLLAGKEEKALSPRILQRNLKTACKKASVPSFSFTQLRNLSIAVELKNGSGVDRVAENAGITTRWFYRFNKVLPELDLSPVKYNTIELRSLKQDP